MMIKRVILIGKIADKIIKLSFEKKKELRILLEYRDESQNYFPKEVFSE